MAFSPSAQLNLASCSRSDTKNDDMKQVWDELPPGHYEEAKKSEPYVRYVDVNNHEPVNYCDRQIYLPFDIDDNKTGKLIALLDTGADINFIMDGYLRTKVPDWRKFKIYNGPSQVRSMTGEPVRPLGHRLLPIRFDRCAPVEMPFVILAEEVPVKCIIGREMLAQFQASLFYANSIKTWPQVGCRAHRYILRVLDPRPANLPLLHLRMPGPFEVRAEYVRLLPKEPTTVRFLMTINPFFTEEDHCLVCFTSVMPDGVVAMDTRCRPKFKKDGKMEVLGMIVNGTDNEITLRIANATVDSTRDYDAMVSIVLKPYFRNEVPKSRLPEARHEEMESCQQEAERSVYLVSHVNHGPDKGYKRLLKKNKFREINGMQGLCFPNYHCNSKPQESCFYCCQIGLLNGEFSNEEPFETAVELLDEEIMPSLALPPRLPTAEEVVLKTLQEEDKEIQPYLRRLFIVKYPTVVRSHNLDTGPVRFLGCIILRTKPGMRLPSISTIYPMNNSDQQHMGDSLEFMQKYGFIGETFQDDPSRPSKPRGASAFLVKRKANPGLPKAVKSEITLEEHFFYVTADSRSLYYLFSNDIVQSHAKVSRYNLKLQADYANVQVLWCNNVQGLWCNTYNNLADLFSRFGLNTKYETKIKFAAEKMYETKIKFAAEKIHRTRDTPDGMKFSHRTRDTPDGMMFSWESWENSVRSHPKAIEVLLDFQKTYKTQDKAKLAKLQVVCHPPVNQFNRSEQRQVKDRSPNVAVSIKPQNPRREIESFQDTIRRRVHYTHASVAQLRYLIKPIKLLRSRLSKANIQIEQSTMMPDLYSKLLQSGNYRCTEEKVNYELIDNVIYCRQDKSSPRIVVPRNMELLCMAYIHLTYGHSSPLQMQKTIEYAYHFQSSQLYKKVKLFCASCTACSLTARKTPKGALRHPSIKPDTPPFTIVTIGLTENLSTFLQYFSHMLIVKCLTTGFTLLFPLKSKAGPEIYYSLLFGVFQPFGLPKCIYSDNAQIFRAHKFRDLLGTLDIELRDTTPLDSKSGGYIERAVRIVKQGIRKHVHSINPPRDRVDVYPLISILNHDLNHNAQFGISPSRLLFGKQINTNGLFDARAFLDDETAPLNMNGDQRLGALPRVIAAQNQNITEHVGKAQQRAEASVKRPVDKKLPPGTLIYVLAQGLGSTGTSKAWAAYYFPSVYSVTHEMETAVIATRLSDGQSICRSKNSVKRVMYWPRFQELPADIRRLLVLRYDQLQQEGLEKLAFSDTFGSLPPGNFENEGVLSQLDGLDMQCDYSSSSSSKKF